MKTTSVETSQILKKLHLPQKSFFYWYPSKIHGWTLTEGNRYRPSLSSSSFEIDWRDISAYTVAELVSFIKRANYQDIQIAFLACGGSPSEHFASSFLKVLDPDFLGRLLIHLIKHKYINLS